MVAMRFLRGGMGLALGPLLLSSAEAGQDQTKQEHDPSVAAIVDHFIQRGMHFDSRQVVRRVVPGDDSTMMGVFATSTIKEGELLLEIPWNCTINAGFRVENPPHLVCDTVQNLIKEMRLGDESDFGPYVQYLLNQRRGQLPCAWSEAGKHLLEHILEYGAGMDGEGTLPPSYVTDNEWLGVCRGLDNPFKENAAMLVIQRAEDDLMLPIYDFYNHRNGDYLNTVNERINKERGQVDFKVYAASDIHEGEEINSSYNMCAGCGGRADNYGTPEIFMDYGFVEMYPQRWIFKEQDFYFDLSEKKNESGELTGDIELTWFKDGRPQSSHRRRVSVRFFVHQIVRIEGLKQLEHAKRKQVPEIQHAVPAYEWNTIWEYSDALVDAMKRAIGANGESPGAGVADEDEDDDEGVCYEGDESARRERKMLPKYDDLDDESDDEFYEEAPYEYTLSCNSNLLFPGHKIMEEFETLYQSVDYFVVPSDGDVCLELDSVVQTCTKYRPHYHELGMDFPARYIDSVKRVLFVGGGDSMLLAEAIKYPDLELVVGLELEQDITRKTFKHMYTQPFFHDRRVQWWFGDAVKSLRLLPKEYFGSFDLVLVDLSETVASFSVSSHLDMLEALALLVKPEGIMVKNEWRYLDKLSGMFKYTARVNMRDIPYICDQAMTMASNKVDFMNHIPNDHKVDRRLLGAHVDIDDRFFMFHDYQKNDIHPHSSCVLMEEGHESDLEHEKSEGIMMIVNAENATEPLSPFGPVLECINASMKEEGLNILSMMSSPSNDNGIGETVIIFMREGYVTARTWPEKNYCAFDVFLWARFDKHEAIRDVVLRAVGTNDASYSDYRIVTGGMLGTESWEEDRDRIGPRFAQRKACKEVYPDEAKEGDVDLGEHSSMLDAVLVKVIALVQDAGSGFIVVCGTKDQPCKSMKAIKGNVGDAEVTALWTCPGIAGEAQHAEDVTSRMDACEEETMNLWSERGRASVIIVDDSTPVTMLKVLNSIISDEANRDVILEEQVIFMELMGSSESKTWRKRHNFMDRVRKSIGFDPLFKAEVVLNSAEEQTELGIMSVEDPAFYPRLYNLTKTLESTGLDVQVRKVLGGVWEWQENYNPQNYTFDDYPTAPAKEQFSRQQPMGRQSVFHLEMEDDSNVARSDVEGALYFALAENTIPVYKLESITEVGDGFVVAALSSEGSIIVVFDGKSHVNVNIFSHDEWEERPDKIMGAFSLKLPFNVVQRDEQPRGTERVINFMSDIHPPEDDSATADSEDEDFAEV
eukprot:CAMPEP_0113586544 /NCGR_PEP_ID=MMETSP0015_2-20120614/34356_1 /TAXON_ID=2838 /ORGANISM="Odontella" /LENGTH=1264 /DNA_ID=CAMNT_0000491993 /DNA_START=143 /DNA_END=3937 /DNA_ORIENTATION=- /assembly_acc=CAM_ASM_000160